MAVKKPSTKGLGIYLALLLAFLLLALTIFWCVSKEEGYYLLLRQEVDDAAIRADCFDSRLLTAAGEADTEPGAKLETLSVPAFYDAVCREREAL